GPARRLLAQPPPGRRRRDEGVEAGGATEGVGVDDDPLSCASSPVLGAPAVANVTILLMVGPPNLSDVVDLVVRLEDDPSRRLVLDSFPYELFRAAVEDGLVTADGITAFASVVGEAVQQGL